MTAHIYFDLDGTLTDPYEGITKSILYALEELDVPLPPDESFREFIGPPLQVTFPKLVGKARAGRAVELYRERFAEIGWQENIPYDGIHDALEKLHSAGNTLFVATTKPWVFAEKIVEHFDMAKHFLAVFGSELDGTRVDKTELLEWALPQNSAGYSAVMIGDRMHDMIGARNNGMDALGVSYGYGTIEELTESGAARIVHTPSELSEVSF